MNTTILCQRFYLFLLLTNRLILRLHHRLTQRMTSRLIDRQINRPTDLLTDRQTNGLLTNGLMDTYCRIMVYF